MALDITEANRTAATSDNPFIIDFLHIDTGTGTTDIRVCSHIMALTTPTSGETYIAAGHLLGFSTIKDNIEARDNTLDISIRGVEGSYSSVILQSNIEGSLVTVSRGYLNEETGQLVADPNERWKGRIDSFGIKDFYNNENKDTIEIQISCRNLLSTVVQREGGRYTSPHSFDNEAGTGDKSMEFVAWAEDFNPFFGKEN